MPADAVELVGDELRVTESRSMGTAHLLDGCVRHHSNYFERDTKEDGGENGKAGFRRYGHAGDHAADLPQIVIGLAVAKAASRCTAGAGRVRPATPRRVSLAFTAPKPTVLWRASMSATSMPTLWSLPDRKPVPEFDAPRPRRTTPRQRPLNEQRLRLTAARDRIDRAAKLLADGDRGQLCACAELRLAVRALQQDQQADE